MYDTTLGLIKSLAWKKSDTGYTCETDRWQYDITVGTDTIRLTGVFRAAGTRSVVTEMYGDSINLIPLARWLAKNAG